MAFYIGKYLSENRKDSSLPTSRRIFYVKSEKVYFDELSNGNLDMPSQVKVILIVFRESRGCDNSPNQTAALRTMIFVYVDATITSIIVTGSIVGFIVTETICY